MKPGIFILGIVLFAWIVAGCSAVSSPVVEPPKNPATVKIANPASTRCIERGGTLSIRSDTSGGQFGVCVFADGSECEEWAFFRDECKPGQTVGGQPAKSTTRYVNSAYGFALDMPEKMKVEALVGRVVLSPPSGDFRLVVGVRWVDEAGEAYRPPAQTGQWQETGVLQVLNQALPRKTLMDRGKVKGWMIGPARFDRLEITNWVEAIIPPGKSYEDIHLPPEVLSEAEAIFTSFSLVKK